MSDLNENKTLVRSGYPESFPYQHVILSYQVQLYHMLKVLVDFLLVSFKYFGIYTTVFEDCKIPDSIKILERIIPPT